MNHNTYRSRCCRAEVYGMRLEDPATKEIYCTSCKKINPQLYIHEPRLCSSCSQPLSDVAVLSPDGRCVDGYCYGCAEKELKMQPVPQRQISLDSVLEIIEKVKRELDIKTPTSYMERVMGQNQFATLLIQRLKEKYGEK